MERREHHVFMRVGQEVTGPVLFNFVAWILRSVVQQGIHTLYFLARDGYVLQKIAEDLINRFSLPVTCKYLYCSRSALRLPTYHLIGEEAYDLLFLGGYCITLDSLLDRANLTNEQKDAIRKELALSRQNDQVLSRQEISELAGQLRQNKRFRKYVNENSKNAYPAAIGYLTQEGLLKEKKVAIVDSGWTGSMQRSLRQLLESAGFSGTITGFYFGMYAQPKDIRDGNYLTWYFDAQGRRLNKTFFCNNLFECILSAPHGMTLSYLQQGDRFAPVLSTGPTAAELERIETQISGILRGVEAYAKTVDQLNSDASVIKKETEKKFRYFMTKPSQEEAEVYGLFPFDDDIKDVNRRELASREQVFRLSGYLIHRRILRKLGRSDPIQELFWPYGTIAFLPKWKQPWYLWNLCVWEWLKFYYKEGLR